MSEVAYLVSHDSSASHGVSGKDEEHGDGKDNEKEDDDRGKQRALLEAN